MKGFGYEETLYRPPSEAYSLILQLTIGCSHNACTFCDMYKDKKFRIRDFEEFKAHVEEIAGYRQGAAKIFLADGNALAADSDFLLQVLNWLKKERFPEVERITTYAGPGDILSKTPEEMRAFKEAGLDMMYLGAESGSAEILDNICKGVTPEEMIQAGRRVKEAGIKLSVTLISGLGGKNMWEKHAKESAAMINGIDPDYLGLLTLMVRPGTPFHDDVASGRFELLDAKEVMMETRALIADLKLTNCVFRSNHVSNYISLGGTFPRDKQMLLDQIDKVLDRDKDKLYRPEFLRHL